MPEPRSTLEDRVASILASWAEARERGEAPRVEDLVRDHPDLEGEVRRRVAALAAFDGLAGTETQDDGIPRTLGDFRLGRRIGRGAMGIVYEAEQVSLRRPAAVKVLHPGLTASPSASERFRREARAAARLRHPAVVPVIEAGEENGFSWFAMERVRGRSLEEVIAERRDGGAASSPPLPESSEAVAILFAGVAEGLHAAHAEGILHRDVKPSNLLLEDSGALRLADFGLARVAGDGASVTTPGVLVGTPYYMSPEQAAGGRSRLDERTDIYSLGATIYETLTLRPPFTGETLPELCRRVSTEDPARPTALRADLPRDLETIVLKAMEKDPARRYASAAEMALDLRLFAAGAPVRARPVGWAGRLLARARRHPRIAALGAGTAALAVTAALFAAAASARETRIRREEYLHLCMLVEEGSPGGQLVGLPVEFGPEIQNAIALLGNAARLLPGRPEAHLGLALQPGSAREDRIRHAGRARERGLGERGYRLLLAYVHHRESDPGAARAEEALADAAPQPSTPLEWYLEGRVLARWGRRAEALDRFTRAVEGVRPGESLRVQALFSRSLGRSAEGDSSGALADLAAANSWEGVAGPGGRVWLSALADRLGPFEPEGAVLGVLPLQGQGGLCAVKPDTGHLAVFDSYQGGSAWVFGRGRLDRPRRIETAAFEVGAAFEPRSGRVVLSQQFARTLLLLDTGGEREPIRVDVPAVAEGPGEVPTIGRVAVDGTRGRVFVRQGADVVRFAARDDGAPVLEGRFPHGIPVDSHVELAVDEASGRLVVASPGYRGVRLLDPGGREPAVEVPLSGGGGPLIVDPDTRRAFVRADSGDRLFVVDLASGAPLDPVLLPPGWAGALALDRRRGLVLVAGSRRDGPLAMIDSRTLERRRVVLLPGGDACSVAVDGESDRAYVVMQEGWLVVVDLAPR